MSSELVVSESTNLYLAEQVIELDHLIMQHEGISATVLMKRAGRHAFALLLEHWPQVQCVHIFCGSGNNGGDGYVMAALARQRNLDVTVWCLTDPSQLKDTLTDAALAAYQYAVQEGVQCREFVAKTFADEQIIQTGETVIVDALLGTGTNRELRDNCLLAVKAINGAQKHQGWPVMAVDIPTGVNPDTGDVASFAVQADVTMSFIGQKRGLYTGAGRVHSGECYFSDLEVDDEWIFLVNPIAHIIDINECLEYLPSRALDAHKGDCGRLLIIGGDSGVGYSYGGAPLMAAEMAQRTGAGLVGVATQPSFVNAIVARQPETMAVGISNGQELLPLLEPATALVIGTGLGQSAWSEQLLYHALMANQPMVIDADALSLLAQDKFKTLLSTLPIKPADRQWILTPHPGEAARLLGISVAQIQEDRFAAAIAIQQRYGGAVLLKGAGTVVISSTGEQWLCDEGNPGMASGGMGDVLSGLLGSLLVQGLSIDHAILLGVVVHSLAADLAADDNGQRGLLATDLIPYARELLDG